MEGSLEKEVHSIHLNFWVDSQLFLSYWQRKEPINILFRGLTGIFRIMTEKYVVWLLSFNSVASYFWWKTERCLAIQIAPLPDSYFLIFELEYYLTVSHKSYKVREEVRSCVGKCVWTWDSDKRPRVPRTQLHCVMVWMETINEIFIKALPPLELYTIDILKWVTRTTLKRWKDLKYQWQLERKKQQQKNGSILGHPLKYSISNTFFKIVYEAKIETKSTVQRNKEKQTFGGDHIFHEYSFSKDLGAETFFPLTLLNFRDVCPTERIPSICALNWLFILLFKYFHVFWFIGFVYADSDCLRKYLLRV